MFNNFANSYEWLYIYKKQMNLLRHGCFFLKSKHAFKITEGIWCYSGYFLLIHINIASSRFGRFGDKGLRLKQAYRDRHEIAYGRCA